MKNRTRLTGLALMLCVAGLGCHTVTRNKGEWRVEFTTGIALHSGATDAGGVEANAGVDANDWLKGGILSWIFGTGEEEPTADGG